LPQDDQEKKDSRKGDSTAQRRVCCSANILKTWGVAGNESFFL